jgi:hypothetical protein
MEAPYTHPQGHAPFYAIVSSRISNEPHRIYEPVPFRCWRTRAEPYLSYVALPKNCCGYCRPFGTPGSGSPFIRASPLFSTLHPRSEPGQSHHTRGHHQGKTGHQFEQVLYLQQTLHAFEDFADREFWVDDMKWIVDDRDRNRHARPFPKWETTTPSKLSCLLSMS